MLISPQDFQRSNPQRARLFDILSVVGLLAFLVFAFTHGPFVDHLMRAHPTASALGGWVVGMLSYHQDARRHGLAWAILSQMFAVVCLIALVTFGFTHRSWLNFLIAPPLFWVHFQFTKRWWAKPGSWW